MAAAKRIYIVEDAESITMVRAYSQAAALAFVCKQKYQVRAASADDVANYMSQGATVDDATATSEPETINGEAPAQE